MNLFGKGGKLKIIKFVNIIFCLVCGGGGYYIMFFLCIYFSLIVYIVIYC